MGGSSIVEYLGIAAKLLLARFLVVPLHSVVD